MPLLPPDARPGREPRPVLLLAAILLLAPLLTVAASEPAAPATLFMDCAARTLVGPQAGDRAGYALAHAGDMDGDGHPDLVVGVPDRDLAGHASGSVYTVRGPIGASLDLTQVASRIDGVNGGDLAGSAIAMGNLNGDGHPDYLIGAPGANPRGGPPTGAAYIVYGPVYGTKSLSHANAVIHGAAYEYVGGSVAYAGDVNGDGIGDILLGVPGRNENAVRDGAAYLFYGPVSGIHGTDQADVILVGEAAYDFAGHFVAGAGDLDDDGYDDLYINAPKNDGGATDGGALYVVRGGPALPARIPLGAADAKIVGTLPGGLAGWTALPVGDIDADGLPELAIGVPHDDLAGTKSGAVHLITPPTSGIVPLTPASRMFLGAAGSETGASLARAGDYDGDGHPDLLIGAWSATHLGVRAGGAYLVRGGPDATTPTQASNGPLAVYGIDQDDNAAYALLGGVDYDEDGEPDIVLSSPWHSGYGFQRGLVSLVDRSTATVDTDADRLTDECETHRYFTDPLRVDTDGDRVADGAEVLDHRSDPLDADTDGDLFGDGTEVENGSDPTDPYSIPVGRLPVTSPVKGPWDPLPFDGMAPLL